MKFLMYSLVFVVILATTTADLSTPYDWTKQICCGGKVYAMSPGSYSTRCCGNSTKTYNYPKELCCYDSKAGEYSVITKATDSSDCCGTKIYDTQKEICCIDTVYKKNLTGTYAGDYWSTNTYCCGNQVFNTDNQVCCDGKVIDGTKCDKSEVNCFANPPTKSNEICCSVWDQKSQKDKYKVVNSTGITNPECCGLNQVYDFEKQTCCGQNNDDGTVQYNITDLPKGWDSPSCCGLTAFNTLTSLCCSSYDPDTQRNTYNVTDYPQAGPNYDIQCCGTTSYNSTKEVCCDDSKSTIIPKDNASTLCCGGKAYDSSTWRCCNNNEVYNTTIQMCCGDYPNSKAVNKADPYDNGCCGGVTFNTGSKMCCDETKGPVPRPTATSTCCGENYSGCGYYYYPYY